MDTSPPRPARRRRAVLSLLMAVITVGVLAPRAADAIPIDPQEPWPPRTTTTRRPTPPPTTTPGPPRYKVEALSFYVNEESGIDWSGSDEPLWVFNSVSGANGTRSASREFGDVDEGERHHFPPLCLVANCAQGVVGPITLQAVVTETDVLGQNGPYYEQLVQQAVSKVCGWAADKATCTALDWAVTQIVDLVGSWLGDDLVQARTIHWPLSDLAGLTYPGMSAVEDITFDDGGDTRYTLRVRTTRMS